MANKSKQLDQALQACLEKIHHERISIETALEAYPGLKEELRPQLEAALWLTSRKTGLQARPGYLTASRKRLVEHLRQDRPDHFRLVLQRTLQILNHRRAVHFVSVILLAAIMLTSNSMARAAQASIPGDASYPVKVTIEQVRLSVSLTERTAAQLHIAYTQRRLSELESVILQGRYGNIPTATVELERQINAAIVLLEGLKRQDAQQAKNYAIVLHKTLTSQADALEGMAQIIPQGDRPSVVQALRIIQNGALTVQERFLQH